MRANRTTDRVEFHGYYASAALAAGVGSVNVNPLGLSSHLAALADTYDLYRIIELEYRLLPNSTITAAQLAAYYPGITDTQPTSAATCAENLDCVILGSQQSVPTAWHKVNKQSLQGYFPWYKTVQGSLDSSEEVQGSIFVVGTGSETFSLELRGVAELKNPVAIGNTPQLRTARRQENQRDKILAILSTPAAASQQSTGSRGPAASPVTGTSRM